MLLPTLTSLLVPLIHFLTGQSQPPAEEYLQFELRHLHAVSSSAHVIFSDMPKSTLNAQSKDGTMIFKTKTRSVKTYKPLSFDSITEARLRSIRFGQSQSLSWSETEVPAPDHESRETLLALAKMANNAYVMQPGDPYWYDLGTNWTSVSLNFPYDCFDPRR